MEQFYVNQAGNGLPLEFYRGARFQRGHGFFGRLISRTVLPLLRYIGKKAFETGRNVYTDYQSGKDIGESIKNRGLDTLKTMVDDGIEHIRQSGRGIKRRRRRRVRVNKSTLKKRVKRSRKKRKKTVKRRRKRTSKKIKRKTVKRKTRKRASLNFL